LLKLAKRSVPLVNLRGLGLRVKVAIAGFFLMVSLERDAQRSELLVRLKPAKPFLASSMAERSSAAPSKLNASASG